MYVADLGPALLTTFMATSSCVCVKVPKMTESQQSDYIILSDNGSKSLTLVNGAKAAGADNLLGHFVALDTDRALLANIVRCWILCLHLDVVECLIVDSFWHNTVFESFGRFNKLLNFEHRMVCFVGRG